jgi:uncharacterized delta-60 repeat protein
VQTASAKETSIMWRTIMALSLVLSGKTPRKAAPCRRSACRRPGLFPRLEALEDRCVPSNAGALDPTFGNGTGYVTMPSSFGFGVSRDTTALIQPNGELVTTGVVQPGNNWVEFGVERYTASGALDTSFGSGSVATASFGAMNAFGVSAALDPYADTANGNDDVVQAGIGSSSNELLLARYTTSGALDTSFGTSGEVTSTFAGVSSIGSARVVVTSSGQLIAFAANSTQFVLARYNANGTLDTTFGQSGYVVTSVPNLNGGGLSPPLLQLPNGQLLAVASQSGGVWNLYRFNADGTPDTTFGNQGVVTTSIGGTMACAVVYPSVGTADDGKILAAGQSAAGTWELARFNPDGSLDATFGTGGVVQTQISGGLEWNDLALDANERIIVGGQNGHTTLLARFNANGTPDTIFGNGGLTTTAFSSTSYFYGVAVYPNAGLATDGDIVAVGSTIPTVNTQSLVARYLGQATASFAISGPSSLTAGTAGSFIVTALNADGTVNTSYTGTVAITSSDPKAVVPANYTFTAADQGVHTFTVILKTAGSQSITATDTATSSITGSESGITITPAAASQFVLSAPSSVKRGVAFSLTLTVEDAYGNVVTGYVGTVHFTSSDSTATLPANYTFTAADAGVHKFTNGAILRKRGTQTITVTDTLNGALTATDTFSVA